MYCPFCANEDTKVLESRILENSLRRRRECLKCSNRFTTYEKAVFKITVLKKDGREELFNMQKLICSIQKACGKAEQDQTNLIAQKVEKKILRKKSHLINTKIIGDYVLSELKKFDKIAYLRFTSIYKSIDDPKILEKELKTIV